MKNFKLISACLIIALLLGGIIINQNYDKEEKKENDDAIKFEEEYESLNGVKRGENEYPTVELSSDNQIIYADYNKVEEIITKDTGVIYFGFPECPWCRNAIPQLIDAAKEVGLEKIYYFNALEIRDIKSLDEDGNIVVKKEGTKEYEKLVELLYDYLGEYEGLNDKTIKRLYFPTVVFVKDGSIIGTHIGTIEEQENPYIPLNKSQKNKLKDIYEEYILKMMGIICDTDIKDKC